MRNMNITILMLMVLTFSGWAGAQGRIGPALKRPNNKDAGIRFKAAEESGQMAPMQPQVIGITNNGG